MRWRAASLIVLVVAATFGPDAFSASSSFVPDPFHTFVYFSYQHMGLSLQQSRFNKTTGRVTYDASAKIATIDLAIDMTSVDTGSTMFNKEIQTAGMLDTKRFPHATFKSTRVTFHDDSPSAIEGELTLNGITKPVTLTVTSFREGLNYEKKHAIGANATTTIKRSDFNAGEYVPIVGDEVILSIAIEAAQT